MPASDFAVIDRIFHPRAIALAGIPISDPGHWTRTFLNSLMEHKFPGPLYLVNPRGGEAKGLKVYRNISEVPGTVDYVISTVPPRLAAAHIAECAAKGVTTIHFCTAGFSETGDPDHARYEDELLKAARQYGVRVIGPNCMGIYCPESHVSFHTEFPRESGPVGFISQSGGNAIDVVMSGRWRGIRFSKTISYGNAVDLDESDFLDYLTEDAQTRIIAIYIEGIRDGRKFRRSLTRASHAKPVVLLKGGVSESGNRAAAGHTAVLASNDHVWEAVCRQSGAIRTYSLEELLDVLVTLIYLPHPGGRRAAVIGPGGGSSVLVGDVFERHGLELPPLPPSIRESIGRFTPIEGNILRNPVDYSQNIVEFDKLAEATRLLARWNESDFIVGYVRPNLAAPHLLGRITPIINAMLQGARSGKKPLAVVFQPGVLPNAALQMADIAEKFLAEGLPIYYSFDGAARAISAVQSWNERREKVA
ncbi:MAG: CoA-binding protein [Dehalococcoidia bacterium]|nr:CoA-binding protein [Dehalococcoidia bacterium]